MSKGMGMSKRGKIKYQEGVLLFFSYQSKLKSHVDFVSVILISPDTTLKERRLE